jgi:hypothetical protein
MKQTIKDFWKSLKTDDGKIKRSFRAFKNDASKVILEKVNTIDELKEELDTLKENSEESRKFEPIAKLMLKIEALEVELEKYTKYYEEVIGEKPKVDM